MPSSTTTPSIAIIGAGPAGLTLANLLLTSSPSINVTIFERRSRPTSSELINTPSGMLDLHTESGLAALAACGLSSKFQEHSGETSEADIVTDHLGNVLHSDDGVPGEERPEISRGALTSILLDGVPDNYIQWNCKLFSVSQRPDGRMELDFGPSSSGHEKTTKVFDLVVGCDGAWSKVRKLLTDVQPTYAGQQYITATVRDVSQKNPAFDKLLGTGTLMALGKKNGVMSHRNMARDHARLYIIVDAPGSQEEGESWAERNGLTSISAAEAGRKLVAADDGIFGVWGQTLRELVVAGCEDETRVWETTGKGETKGELDVKPMYILPIGHSWVHKRGVTAIGDAAHLMGPWAGEGVNMAMKDALELSKVLLKGSGGGDWDQGVKVFEKEMSERCGEKAEEAARNNRVMFGDDEGGKTMAQWFASFGPPPE